MWDYFVLLTTSRWERREEVFSDSSRASASCSWISWRSCTLQPCWDLPGTPVDRRCNIPRWIFLHPEAIRMNQTCFLSDFICFVSTSNLDPSFCFGSSQSWTSWPKSRTAGRSRGDKELQVQEPLHGSDVQPVLLWCSLSLELKGKWAKTPD